VFSRQAVDHRRHSRVSLLQGPENVLVFDEVMPVQLLMHNVQFTARSAIAASCAIARANVPRSRPNLWCDIINNVTIDALPSSSRSRGACTTEDYNEPRDPTWSPRRGGRERPDATSIDKRRFWESIWRRLLLSQGRTGEIDAQSFAYVLAWNRDPGVAGAFALGLLRGSQVCRSQRDGWYPGHRRTGREHSRTRTRWEWWRRRNERLDALRRCHRHRNWWRRWNGIICRRNSRLRSGR